MKKLHLFVGIFILFALSGSLWLIPGTVAEPIVPRVNAEAQERIAQLIQNVLGPYRAATTLTNGIPNSSVTYSNIEMSFREASGLMPDRLDLRFGIASALIGQATLTNSQFDLNMRKALNVYQEIQALDTNGFQAALLYAAYTRALGETDTSKSTLGALMVMHPQRTREYLQKFHSIDEAVQVTPNENLQQLKGFGREHGIVVLGAALETNGMMKPKLLGRLRQGLLIARCNPEAPIIVTGGNQRGGVTEAYAMSHWFMDQGISTNRLHVEDQSRDTVGNAIYSCVILEKLEITHVTLVTSASHLRRSLADFQEASLQRGLHLKFTHFVSKDDSVVDELRERVAIYRDVLRTSGIWAYPGFQR